MNQASGIVREITVWLLPVLISITFHEAAHGLVAHLRGDDTAWRLGRVSFNPLRHIDPFGTVLLPGMLLLVHAPFLFGYAKPVPVNFRALRRPRLDMILVAAAGPGINLLLALLCALAFHVVDYAPPDAALWLAENLRNALLMNVVLAVFNLLPLPPLDGGRIIVGLLPMRLARPFARLEPFGMPILLVLLIVLPMLGRQFGTNLDVISVYLARASAGIIEAIVRVTGLG